MLPFQLGLDEDSALTAIESGQRIILQYPGLADIEMNHLSGFFHRLFSRFNIGFISEFLIVLIKEIASNCSRAHAKRLYFRERGLNLKDEETYLRHIKEYSQDVLGHWDDFCLIHGNNNYYIRLKIQKEDDRLVLSVENNAEIIPIEWKRIEFRQEVFERINNIDRAFSSVRDSTEGAGLGIVMTLLLLRNSNIPPEGFQIKSADGITVTTLEVPLNLMPAQIRARFRDEVLAEVQRLPSLPDNLLELMHLCDSPQATVRQIATTLGHDPGLAAQVLKLVRSAGYITRIRNPTLEDAVKIIGTKTLRMVFLVGGARKLLVDHFRKKDLELIWEKSNRVSYFARSLGSNSGETTEQAVLAGLLCELGKIIMVSLRPDQMKKIHELVDNTRVRAGYVVEEITLGISQSEIGALIAERWNFPEPLITAIRYQQRPLVAPEKYRELVEKVYVAVGLQEAVTNTHYYYMLEPLILKKFGLDDPKVFRSRCLQLTEKYEKSMMAD